MSIRLNKFLSESGICSRRKADELISAGKVLINGQIATLGTKVDPEKDEIKLDDILVKIKEDLIYYAIYKPRGIVSTANDEMNRRTVIDLVPQIPKVYPVGRLDKDSEGLMILTNDGELTNLLTHPKNKHEKEYEVTVSGIGYQVLGNDQIDDLKKQFLNGVVIDNKRMKADSVEVSMLPNTKCLIRMVIHTGYNRQIRKMCDKLNLSVEKLVRTRIANLTLKELGLEPGGAKIIAKSDIV